ncbi:MAG: bifunctional tRNA (5-methylaminomethyl-2-thiouridine)(34)-methyltransferase MnmD/FAD-dependent 5-carboxymethylaminomethyl-2-thiouridine(34) oxidoreductase MnmC, partial [Gammaproteobacteria bacterium]
MPAPRPAAVRQTQGRRCWTVGSYGRVLYPCTDTAGVPVTAKQKKTFWRVTPATLDWQDGAPVSRQYGDIYFSRADGLAETRHVFLASNGLPERWQQHGRHNFTIAETGFGTGLNFLTTWQAWSGHMAASGNKENWLHFISVEKHPLHPSDLARAHQAFPELAEWARLLQAAYPPLLKGHHLRRWEDHRISLHLVFDDALPAFDELLDAPDRPNRCVDAWYLDGFAPKSNPDLWQPALFERMAQLSASDATVATFSAVGDMRRALEQAGFRVERKPGFGQKRHMTTACFGNVTPSSNPRGQWHLPLATAPVDTRTAIVIGAGIAGASTAHSLALRGVDVTVIAPETSDAERASGNRHGILFHRLPAGDGELARFSQQAFLYSSHYYRHAVASGVLPPTCLHSEGMLQLAPNDEQVQQWQQLCEDYADAAGLAHWLSNQEASAIAGLPLPGPALHWPGSATISPTAICDALVNHPRIKRMTAEAHQLHRMNDQWQVLDAHGNTIASTGNVVIACGTASSRFAQTRWLPFKPLRGQVSHVPAHAQSTQLRCAVCHDGYITPASDGMHCVGATFDLNDDNTAISDTSHRDNLTQLQQHWP